MPKLRLEKLLRLSGKFRNAYETEQAIKSGRVSVDGKTIISPSYGVSEKKKVALDGEPITAEKLELKYYVFNKPKGVVCQRGEKKKSVFDFFKDKTLFAVGRLDEDTTGIIIVTNDGRLSHKIASPESRTEKTYEATIDSPISESDIRKLSSGVTIDLDGEPYTTLPCRVVQLSPTKIEMAITEGKKRQVRRMLNAIGRNVVELKRTRIGSLALDIPEGKHRPLSDSEMKALL